MSGGSGGAGRDDAHTHDEHDHGKDRGRGSGHDHDHEHDRGHSGHGGHSHGVTVSVDTDRRYLRMALGLILVYMVIEVVAGFSAHSLALISDAGHMLTDAASLALALFAMRLSARPATRRLTYGFKRVEILSAQANGITLLVLVGIFVYEAIGRLIHPPQVDGGVVLAVALAGLVINGGAALLISRANRASLNIEGAFQHILNDAWAFAATAVSGLIVLTTGFVRADALASLVVAALMFRAGLTLVREAWKIFLEAAPAGMDTAAVRAALVADSEVESVHDLHIWTITSGFPALSAHVLVQPGGDCHQVRGRLEEVLHGDYGIRHTTLQVDHAAESLLVIGRPGSIGLPGPGGRSGGYASGRSDDHSGGQVGEQAGGQTGEQADDHGSGSPGGRPGDRSAERTGHPGHIGHAGQRPDQPGGGCHGR